MVTYFNRKDLVSFGEYLLSDRRKQLYLDIEKHEPLMNLEPAEERLKTVSHADLSNWLDSIGINPVGKVSRGSLEVGVEVTINGYHLEDLLIQLLEEYGDEELLRRIKAID